VVQKHSGFFYRTGESLFQNMAGTPPVAGVARDARETLRECAQNMLNCISGLETGM